ncbi:MAG: YbaK/EbsC family protein [Candidatus Caldarchaeum sp.]
MSERLRRYVAQHGLMVEFVVLRPEQARTSESAATAVGCELSQIAKSIVLKGSRTYLVVLAGDKRIDLKKFTRMVNEPVHLAKPEEVLEETGYPVGSVPPFGHIKQIRTYVDKSILNHSVVYASGGDDSSLIKINANDLVHHLRNNIVDVSK